MKPGIVARLVASFALGVACTLAAAQDNAQQLFFQGFDLLKAGKGREAAAKFEAGLKVEPGNALARHFLGEAYLSTGEKNLAEEQYRKSLELDPNSQVAADARKRLGELSGNVFAGGTGQPGGQGGNAAGVPAPGTEIQDCAQCPVVVVVPPGQFVMGSPPSETGREDDEGPPHIVTIAKPFAVGKYEVTFDEWNACVRDKGCAPAKDEGWGQGRRPVIHVNYEQAAGYAEWLSDKTGKKYRLLSEAEWEYAARAGSDKARFWGSSPDRACQFANVYDVTGKAKHGFSWENFTCDDGHAVTAPVGSYKPNAFGLHDMLGNVWEWVEDCWNGGYQGAPTNGSAWSSGDCSRRVIRGGSWDSVPARVRSANRNWFEPARRGNFLGYRIARTLP